MNIFSKSSIKFLPIIRPKILRSTNTLSKILYYASKNLFQKLHLYFKDPLSKLCQDFSENVYLHLLLKGFAKICVQNSTKNPRFSRAILRFHHQYFKEVHHKFVEANSLMILLVVLIIFGSFSFKIFY